MAWSIARASGVRTSRGEGIEARAFKKFE
jgi:hypothetical protein